MKKNFVIKLLMLSVAACITISGCGDEPSSPAQSTEVQSSGNTNKVEGLQKSEPQYDPVTTPVAVVEDEVDVAEEEQSMPAPMKEILDARPEDNKVQIYDYIEAENEVSAYGFTINPNTNVDDYIKTDN
ncbi:MAG: hypothetical protein IKI75_01565 [Lachnospiraceae bacterium]|nr:hypothetical protein [Lachnospiraceae bacterium]